MLKKSLLLIVAAALSSVAVTAQASKSEGGEKARQGVVRCGGNNFLRLPNMPPGAGSEIHFTSWVFRNFDASNDITFERMRVFDARGAVLFDSASSTLPLSSTGNVGPGDNVLEANETTQFNSNEFLPFLPATNRPIQLELQWSSPRPALTLDAITVRISRGRDPLLPQGQQQLEERGRHAIECRTISTR